MQIQLPSHGVASAFPRPGRGSQSSGLLWLAPAAWLDTLCQGLSDPGPSPSSLWDWFSLSPSTHSKVGWQLASGINQGLQGG